MANGATKEISPNALRKFGADVICLNQGEGLINDEVGSEFTHGLSRRVNKEKQTSALPMMEMATELFSLMKKEEN